MTKDKRKIKENIYKKLNKDPKELLAYIEEKLSNGSYPSLTFISVCASIPAEKYLPYDKTMIISKLRECNRTARATGYYAYKKGELYTYCKEYESPHDYLIGPIMGIVFFMIFGALITMVVLCANNVMPWYIALMTALVGFSMMGFLAYIFVKEDCDGYVQ